MKRFRFTLIAVCLVLLYLGWSDASLFLRNQTPETVPAAELTAKGAPREWLHVVGGHLDLEQAISTSGSVDVDALLVPLRPTRDGDEIPILVETRDPRLMELFTTYHFKQDSAFAKERYLDEHRTAFHPRRDVIGMVVGGLIASGNRDKMMQLAEKLEMAVPEDVIFLSEGKEPPRYRGFFFLAVGLLGLGKILLGWRRKGTAGSSPEA